MQAGFGETVLPARGHAEDVLRSPSARFEAWHADFDEPAETSRAGGTFAATAQRVRRFGHSFDERAAVFGALGFISGMIVWHAVGFWSFMSNVVLNSPDPNPSRPPIAAHSTAASGSSSAIGFPATGAITTGSIAPATVVKRRGASSADLCLALELDRASGTTRTASCPDDGRVLRDAGFQRRADRVTTTPRLENATAWATGTALSADAAAAPETVSENDFSLEIRTEP